MTAGYDCYYTSYNGDNFRAEFEDQGWSKPDFAKHIDTKKLSNYDALFFLTPRKNIPDDEAQAIINWVLEGGQLVITQDNCGTYANEITETFGIEFGDGSLSYINEFASYPVTAGLTEVNGITVRKIIVSGSSEETGWYDGCCCANDLSPGS